MNTGVGKPSGAWLWLMPIHLGDCLCAAVLVRAALALENGPGTIDVVVSREMRPLLAEVVGVRRAFAYDDIALLATAYDWIIDLSTTPLGVGLADRLIFSRLVRRKLADPRVIQIFAKGANAVDYFVSPTFDERGSGRSGDPNIPIWALHAPLVARAAERNFWPWFDALRSRTLDVQYKRVPTPERGADVEVTFAPCASQWAKRWPQEQWLHLARSALTAGWRMNVVLGPDEHGCAETLCRLDGVRVHHSMDLTELARLLARQDLVVANDCGPMHLAASQGTPTLALFGPTNPRCWFFYNGPGQKALQTSRRYNRWSRIDRPAEPWTNWPSSASVFAEATRILGGIVG